MDMLRELIYHQKSSLSQQSFKDWLAGDMLPTLEKLQLRGESLFLEKHYMTSIGSTVQKN